MSRRLLLVLLLTSIFPAVAAAQEEGFVDPDSAFKSVQTTYESSYERDRTRGVWTQSLAYGKSLSRASFNVSSSVSTQDFIASRSKSTLGSVNGMLNFLVVKNLMGVITGTYGMNSTKDERSGQDTRDNLLNLRLQYSLGRGDAFHSYVSAYTEFGQKHELNETQGIIPGDPDAAVRVDSSVVQRDSSYTSTRKDGLMQNYFWNPRSWLSLGGSAEAYRIHPSISSFNRTFVNPFDTSGGGYGLASKERTQSPSGNSVFTQRISFPKLRLSKLDLYGERRRLAQSYFDKQRARQETASLENTLGRLHFDTSVLPRFQFNTDASLGRVQNTYTVNTSRNQLTRDRKIYSSLTYADSSRRANVNFLVDRSRTEQNPNVNGVEINRVLGGTANWRASPRLALDALASINLLSDDYENDRNDRDVQRTSLSLGAGYKLAPPCSTTVRFSRIGAHVVNLDPIHSAENAMTTTYQLNATMQYLPNPDFSIRQSYVLSAEYRILDYVESQNSLRRTRRIDTNMSDTLLSVVFLTLSHNFVFQDQGTYARFDGQSERLYLVKTRSYAQTLTVTVGLKIIPGVTFVTTQDLLNNRFRALTNGTSTLQNTWKLNMGLLVSRTMREIGIEGAVRRIEEYDEVNPTTKPRRDWIAGVTVHRGF